MYMKNLLINSRKNILLFIIFLIKLPLFSQEDSIDSLKIYSKIEGYYEFDLSDMKLGNIMFIFFEENNALFWAQVKTNIEAAELIPKGDDYIFSYEDKCLRFQVVQ